MVLKTILLFLLSFLGVGLTPAFAISFNDAVFPELITSTRAQAMGNAFIAKVDDSDAAFYNPAGLGTVRGGHFHLFNIYAETNADLLSMGTDGKFHEAAGNAFDGFSKDGSRELLLENRGKITYNRIQAKPNILFRFFSLGFMFSKKVKTTIGNDAADQFEYAERTDYGPYAAMNISLFGGVFKFGGSATVLTRKEAIGESDPNTTIELEDSDYNKGSMLYVVGGAKLTLPIVLLPTFAATIHNATNGSFSGDGELADIRQTVDVGFSITPQIGKKVRIHLEGNYKDIAQAYPDIAATRRFVLGAELDIARRVFFRFGYGDGFGTYGMGIRSQHYEFDIGSYAVDTTADAFRGQEDRRYSFTLSTGF